MSSIKIDFNKLLGYRLIEKEAQANAVLSAKIGDKPGLKSAKSTGLKLGEKGGAKLGGKVGSKEGRKLNF